MHAPSSGEHNDARRSSQHSGSKLNCQSERNYVRQSSIGVINLNYRLFTYEYQRPPSPPTIRSWLPGYFFIEFDMLHDAWGQLNRIPGVIEIPKRPLEAELIPVVRSVIEQLDARI